MRLIGGNISDTPVKEIGDGSAFTVGGGGAGRIDPLAAGLSTANMLLTAPNGTASNGCYVASLFVDYDPNILTDIIASHSSYSDRRLGVFRFEAGSMGGSLQNLWFPAGTSIDFDHGDYGNSGMRCCWYDIEQPAWTWNAFTQLSYATGSGTLVAGAANTAGINVIYSAENRDHAAVIMGGKTIAGGIEADLGNWCMSPIHIPAGGAYADANPEALVFYEDLS